MRTGKDTWLVMRRDVSGTVTIYDTPSVHLALVLDPRDGRALGGVPGRSHDEALRQALAMAASGRMAARRPSPPARILCPSPVAEPVRAELAALDIRAPVEDVVPGDEAEDVFDSLVAHMSGRRPAADPPSPDAWTRLYAQARRYLEQQPWERFDDAVRFPMTLDTGRSRREAVGVVLGAAGEQRGLVLYPGREVPAIPDDADLPRSLPAGTIALFVDDEGAPADLAAKAGRYGWPATADRMPVLLAWDGEGRPGELDASMAATMTLALAAVLDRDATRMEPAGAGSSELRAELALAGGRRGRYRVAAVLPEPPPGDASLLVLGGEIRDDLLPRGSRVTITRYPWTEMPKLRLTADHHQPAPSAWSEKGQNVPVVMIVASGRSARKVVSRVADARPVGVALIEDGPHAFLVLVCERALFGLTGEADARSAALTNLKRWLKASDGRHGLVVAADPERLPPAYGFFELRLMTALPRSGGVRRGRRSPRRS